MSKDLERLGLQSLSELMHKRLRITCDDASVFEGEAITFEDSVMSETGKECIGLDQGDYVVDLEESDIASIEFLTGEAMVRQ